MGHATEYIFIYIYTGEIQLLYISRQEMDQNQDLFGCVMLFNNVLSTAERKIV